MAEQRGRGRPRGPGVDPALRREALLDAAERAVRAKGAAASLGDVAREAGFARSAVYAAFPGKSGVLIALSRRHSDRLLAEMLTRALAVPEPEAQFHAILDVLFAWAQAEPLLYRTLIHPPDDEPSELFELLASAIEAMLVHTGTPTDLATPSAHAMLGSTTAAIDWWLRSGAGLPRDRLVARLSALAWHGGAALPQGWMGVPPAPENDN